MRPLTAAAFCVLSLGLAFPARAEDPSTPPAPPPVAPPAAQTSPVVAEPESPAPGQHRHHVRPAFVLGDLTVKLGLTPDQQKQVGAFIDDGAAQLKQARADESLSKEDKHAKLMGINKVTRGQIRGVLTPDQQKQFDALPASGPRQQPPVTDAKPPAN